MNRFEGKVIAIAGGCGTVGSGVSQRLAEEGALVVLGDLDFEAAEKLAAEINGKGGRATPVRLDIGDEASVRAFTETAVKLHGGIDGFHANAVMPSHGDDDDIVTMDLGFYDRLMHVNQRGYMLCTRAAVPLLVDRGGGAILYTSSGAAHDGLATLPCYSMAKSGVHALMRHVAARYGPKGVRSNVVACGRIMSQRLWDTLDPGPVAVSIERTKLKKAGEAADIAAMAALLLSDDGKFVTSQVISVDGGTTYRP